MREFQEILGSVRLFAGIAQEDYPAMLACLDARVAEVKKDDFLLLAGDRPTHVGVVLSGRLHVSRVDLDGNRSLLASLLPGDFFAEALCCAGVKESPVSVQADTEGQTMLIPFARILHTCPQSCSFHSRLLENMLGVLAHKNLTLQSRMEALGHKNLRGRLLCYLEAAAVGQGRRFSIPFNREELADYLCVDRSALSRELGLLKKEGMLDYWKNNFEWKKGEEKA